MPSLRRPVFAAWLCAALGLARGAAADDVAEAKALFDRGFADMQAGRYEPGCKAIAESLRLDPRPGTLFTLATCEWEWGRTATAITRYDEYLRLYEKLPAAEQTRQSGRAKIARANREQLAKEAPRWILSLPPDAPQGTVVKIDGEPLNQALLGTAMPVDPGTHVVSTHAPDGAFWGQKLWVEKGETRRITLTVNTLPSPSPMKTRPAEKRARLEVAPRSTVAEAPRTQRAIGFVLLGVGGAGLVSGAVTGTLALREKEVADAHCGRAVGSADPAACDLQGVDAGQQARAFALASDVGIVAGGIGAAIGVLLVITAPKSSAASTKPRTGSALPGLHFGVVRAGRDGAMVGLDGAF